MKKICFITTMSSSIDNWIKPFLQMYHNEGIDISIVCNMTNEYKMKLTEEYPYVRAFSVNMPRGADLAGTLRSIPALTKIFKSEKFDMIQYSTPNASFYSSVAGKLAKIPVRLYCQWGMVFVAYSGFKRKIFETIERITCKLSTIVQPDSKGNLDFCRSMGFYTEKKSDVIWNGSAKGVNLDIFDISKKDKWRKEIREKYSIADTDIVLGFVGRLGRDKGCNELFGAFKKLSAMIPNLKLLFVGPIEKEDTIADLDYFRSEEKIIKTDRVSDVYRYYSAMDIFILPSYREGFGMSVVEAEAMGVPVIVTDIPGPVNGMINGKTGVTIPVRNTDAIVNAVKNMADNPLLIEEYGKEAAAYAAENFDSRIFAEKLLENRKKLLGLK